MNNQNEPPSLWKESPPAGNWILLQLEGTKSNRSAIGARVSVTAAGHAQVEEVRSGGSYLSQSDLRLHFGIGAAKAVDRVDIRWPSDADRGRRAGERCYAGAREGVPGALRDLVKTTGRPYTLIPLWARPISKNRASASRQRVVCSPWQRPRPWGRRCQRSPRHLTLAGDLTSRPPGIKLQKQAKAPAPHGRGRSVRRGRSVDDHLRHPFAFRHLIIRRDLEQRCVRIGAAHVGDGKNGLAHARIAVHRLDVGL